MSIIFYRRSNSQVQHSKLVWDLVI